jgi:hypothetical protein
MLWARAWPVRLALVTSATASSATIALACREPPGLGPFVRGPVPHAYAVEPSERRKLVERERAAAVLRRLENDVHDHTALHGSLKARQDLRNLVRRKADDKEPVLGGGDDFRHDRRGEPDRLSGVGAGPDWADTPVVIAVACRATNRHCESKSGARHLWLRLPVAEEPTDHRGEVGSGSNRERSLLRCCAWTVRASQHGDELLALPLRQRLCHGEDDVLEVGHKPGKRAAPLTPNVSTSAARSRKRFPRSQEVSDAN